jgi:chromosome segregation ATPase
LAALEAVHKEAAARGRALEEMAAALQERDQRIGAIEKRLELFRAENEELKTAMLGIQGAADERLISLEAIHREAAARAGILEELTNAVQSRDRRIAALEQDLSTAHENLHSSMTGIAERDSHIAGIYKAADERLAVLERTHLEAAKRLSIMDEMTAAIEERDRRIAGLERRLTSRIGRFAGNILWSSKK